MIVAQEIAVPPVGAVATDFEPPRGWRVAWLAIVDAGGGGGLAYQALITEPPGLPAVIGVNSMDGGYRGDGPRIPLPVSRITRRVRAAFQGNAITGILVYGLEHD